MTVGSVNNTYPSSAFYNSIRLEDFIDFIASKHRFFDFVISLTVTFTYFAVYIVN